MKDYITEEMLNMAKTENEQALIKCLLNSMMMLDSYISEIQSMNRMLLIKDQQKLNQDVILQTLDLL